jgi:hypothetical protein
MADGDETLRAIVKRLRAFGLAASMATEAVPLVEAAVKATAAAGTDPYGEPWRPKKDGGRALPDAADAVSVESNGKIIRITVRGGEAAQNRYGVRRLLPRRKLPKAILEALREGARRAWVKAMST